MFFKHKLKLPKNVKIIVSDFDGILTDNFAYINHEKIITKRLNFRDLMAISLLVKAGYKMAIISGEKHSAIDLIKEKFNLQDVHQDIRAKKDVLISIAETYGFSPNEIVYIGDDVNDIECLNFAGTKITVPNAANKVKKVKNIQITTKTGGNGAFREVVDCLLNI